MRGNDAARVMGALLAMLVALWVLPGPAARGETPSAEEAYEVYQRVGAWLRQQTLPGRNAARAERAIDPANCAGASVVLRLSGQVIGRAEVISESGTAVWQATNEAWGEARAHLIEGLPNDALYEDRLRQRLDRMTLDLQLAGELIPLPAETFSAAAALINPGRQGAAARSGEAFAAIFPGSILSFPSTVEAGFDPGERALRAATTRLGLPPADLAVIRGSNEVTLYRFDVIHLAQVRAGTAPSFLSRGGRLVSEAAVTGTNLRSAADDAAEYLIRLEWPGEEPLGMLGDYRATANRYEPYIAPPREQATAAFALARYANAGTTAPARARHSAEYAAGLLTQLTKVTEDEVDPRTEPVALATWLLAWAELQSAPAELQDAVVDEQRRVARAAAESLLSEEIIASTERFGPAAQSLRAYALAKAMAHLPGDIATQAGEAAGKEVRRLFRELPTPQLVAAMPWLGWAELELSEGEDTVPASIALRELRELVWEFQIDAASAGATDADFVGGIVFSRGSTQLPTWQSLRPLALIATMLGDERLTDDSELYAELAPLLRSMRFVMQLSASEAEGHMYPVPERALGGVRLSLWEQTTSVDATSLGLVALCEMLESLEVRSGG